MTLSNLCPSMKRWGCSPTSSSAYGAHFDAYLLVWVLYMEKASSYIKVNQEFGPHQIILALDLIPLLKISGLLLVDFFEI